MAMADSTLRTPYSVKSIYNRFLLDSKDKFPYLLSFLIKSKCQLC